MNIEEIREFALSFPDVTEGFPFGETVLVFKKKNKMFLLLPLDEEITQFNVKCDPEKAIESREEYPETVLPGFHMNKKHWNTIICSGQLEEDELKDLIRHSFELVSAS